MLWPMLEYEFASLGIRHPSDTLILRPQSIGETTINVFRIFPYRESLGESFGSPL